MSLKDYVAIIYDIVIMPNGYVLLNPVDYGVGHINNDGKFIDNNNSDLNCYSVGDLRSYDFDDELYSCYDYEISIKDIVSNFNVDIKDRATASKNIKEALRSYYESLIENITFVKFDKDCFCKIVVPKSKINDMAISEDLEESRVIIPLKDMEKLVAGDDKKALDKLRDFLEKYKREELANNEKNVNVNKNDNGGIRRKFDYEDFEKYLKSKIIGQDEGIEKIATNIAMNYRTADKKNLKKMLLVAPTGVGKTETFESIASYLDIPLTIYPTSSITQAGYVGKNIEDVLYTAYNNSNNDISRAENSIVLFDEFDKIAKRGASVNDEAVQNILLKFMDGQKYTIDIDEGVMNFRNNSLTMDSSLITIACAGAFSDIYENRSKNKSLGFQVKDEIKAIKEESTTKEELIKYGMIRELIGRFSSVIQYNHLSSDNLYKILVTPTCSPLKRFQDLIYNVFKVEIIAEDSYIKRIANDAYKLNTGARSLQEKVGDSTSCIERYLLMNQDVKSIILNEDTVTDPHKFLIKK